MKQQATGIMIDDHQMESPSQTCGNDEEDEEMEIEFPPEVKHTMSLFDILSNDVLAHVASYCDFQSALRFTRSTSSSLRQELYAGKGHHTLWKQIFQRHRFSLPTTKTSIDFLQETRKRRQLAQNLLVPRRKTKTKAYSSRRSSCFNVPNRCFSFVPVTPDSLLFSEWDDPPPVDFGCDSYIMTSAACGSEMVLLDPFHGTLAVYDNCLDNAVASDEGMMEQAMLVAANLIDERRERNNSLEMIEGDFPEEEHIAGAVFDQSVYLNHNIMQYKKPPSQILFRLESEIDLDALFELSGTQIPEDPNEIPDIEVGYHGIDVKCLLKDKVPVGALVALGRMCTMETRGQANGRSEEVACTELICWTKEEGQSEYGSRRMCRFPWSFRSIDICPSKNRVYVSFDCTDGSVGRSNSGNPVPTQGSAVVVAYPMLSYPPSAFFDTQCADVQKFQNPEFILRCQGDVTALAVDPTGDTLAVGTTKGTCEIWAVNSDKHGNANNRRSRVISIKSSISKALKVSDVVEGVSSSNQQEEVALNDLSRMRQTIFTILKRPKIASFHHPSHLPFSDCGFVTLQHSSSDGSSLLLWRNEENPSSYKIVSVINLPLSATPRAPRVFYDGRRILVFGQDHIGMIILVYHVLVSNEDIDLFQETNRSKNEETSGGVYNLTNLSHVRFANRIRHAALGGLQHYESIHMACNDRFIVVNTKTGNLLSDSTSPYAEGLLVIDLQDG